MWYRFSLPFLTSRTVSTAPGAKVWRTWRRISRSWRRFLETRTPGGSSGVCSAFHFFFDRPRAFLIVVTAGKEGENHRLEFGILSLPCCEIRLKQSMLQCIRINGFGRSVILPLVSIKYGCVGNKRWAWVRLLCQAVTPTSELLEWRIQLCYWLDP